MICYTETHLKEYLKSDWIMDMLTALEEPEDMKFRTHKWLKEMDNKRMIYADIYGDLLKEKRGLKVLDVGEGYTSLTKALIKNQDYTLLDFMAHGSADYIQELFLGGNASLVIDDWYDVSHGTYDVVIANDLFPDVDQRLELFIKRFLPRCKELRLLVTFYNQPKFYTTKRIDDTEILTFLSYDGEITSMILKKFQYAMESSDEDIDGLKNFKESIYRNGRQVCYVRLKGKLMQNA